MTQCERIGIAGGCGVECEVFLDGECSVGHEFPIEEADDEDMVELIQNYIEEEEYRVKKETMKKQAIEGEMEKPFTITKQFIANMLITYYRGDDSLKNPLKMFIENEAFDGEVLETVKETNRLLPEHKNFFRIDLFLNGFGHGNDEVISLLKTVLNKNNTKLSITHENAIRANFREADLSKTQFVMIDTDFDCLLDGDLDVKTYAMAREIAQHKDFPYEAKQKIYESTGDSSYLAEDVQEIFVF